MLVLIAINLNMKCANIVVKLELGFVWHLNAIMCKDCGH